MKLEMLLAMERLGPVPKTNIEQTCGFSYENTLALLDEFKALGLAEPFDEEVDRRLKFPPPERVYLTPAGLQIVEELRKMLLAIGEGPQEIKVSIWK